MEEVTEITLEQVLAAREARVREQDRLLAAYGVPVVSFTMNIPGPVKDTPLIRRAFFSGRAALDAALAEAGLAVESAATLTAPTGCEALYAVRGEALTVKRVCTRIENATALGRLFDMDVLDEDGRKLDRAEVSNGARRCIVCGAEGRGCASRRTHTVEELQAAVRRILHTHFAEADAREVADRVTKALLDEVYTTPKPGLVDRNNNGSHRDMTVATFKCSAEALRGYWGQCFKLGRESGGQAPDETFALLRRAGIEAERVMLEATGGVNTHKGAIFTLGVVCGAIGRLWRAEAPCRDVGTILRECSAMTRAAVDAELTALSAHPERAVTKGQRLYLDYGMRGIRGEVADGLPSVVETSLPAFRAALAAGYDRNGAGVYALLALVARGADTNMVARGGMDAAQKAVEDVSRLLSGTDFPPMDDVLRLDEAYIRANLSPGGCADLLAVTYFLCDWCSEAMPNH